MYMVTPVRAESPGLMCKRYETNARALQDRHDTTMTDTSAPSRTSARPRRSTPARGEAEGRTREARETTRRDRTGADSSTKTGFGVIVFFFLIVAIPAEFSIADVKLSFLRLFVVLMALPLFFKVVSGRYGGFLKPDALFLTYIIWGFLIITLHHGIDKSIKYSVVQGLLLFVPYLLGRTAVRSPEGFAFVLKCALVLIFFLTPFALYEMLTERLILSEIFSKIPGFKVYDNVIHPPRMGLYRAQATFEHPILWGMFCSITVMSSWYVFGASKTPGSRFLWTPIGVIGTFTSISSGALLALMTQFMLAGWDMVTRTIEKRWRLLTILVVTTYIALDIAANRSPAQIFIATATFNSSSGFNRLLIWEYGSAEVIRNPIFGLGLKDWIRAPWMVSSIDNFWLVIAMRYGLPGFILFTLPLAIILARVGRMDFTHDPQRAGCQMGYIIALVGMFMGLCTVHMWEGPAAFMMFFIGAGVWMFTTPHKTADGAEDAEPDDPRARRRTRLARGGDRNGSRRGSRDRDMPERFTRQER